MAALQIKDVPPEFMQALKLAALRKRQTLREFVVDTLSEAVQPADLLPHTNQTNTPPVATKHQSRGK